jgi:hypothetical protein
MVGTLAEVKEKLWFKPLTGSGVPKLLPRSNSATAVELRIFEELPINTQARAPAKPTGRAFASLLKSVPLTRLLRGLPLERTDGTWGVPSIGVNLVSTSPKVGVPPAPMMPREKNNEFELFRIDAPDASTTGIPFGPLPEPV